MVQSLDNGCDILAACHTCFDPDPSKRVSWPAGTRGPYCPGSLPEIPMPVSTAEFTDLLALARSAREQAYVPYSHFQVGAALLTCDGRQVSGCNVENASYGLCNCAERTALFSAVAAGCRPGDFAALAVIADTDAPVSPCGACRQVMSELCDGAMPVLMANLSGDTQQTTVAALLPGPFKLSLPA
jgi:cytidine deaminase